MFSSKQRKQILCWGPACVLGLSIAPLVRHDLFVLVVFQYYLPLAIIAFGIYAVYRVLTHSRTNNQDIASTLKQLISRKQP